jgi:UDP-2,4-diacetamido-2,4,6-trideoxy-beta-L-altropyranose hydrolase
MSIPLTGAKQSSHVEPERVIVFRVDASIGMGTGHLMRCLTLAHNLREMGMTPCFVCRIQSGDRSDLIHQQGFRCYHLPAHHDEASFASSAYELVTSWQQDVKETCQAISSLHPLAFVVDHYGIDWRWEKALTRAYPGAPLLVIDDLANRQHHCSLLLDQTPNRTTAEYLSLLSEDCACLLGSSYALLRDEFNRPSPRRSAPDANEAWHILVSLGGTDPDNRTLEVLAHLAQLPQRSPRTEICVIMGKHAPHLSDISAWCQQQQQQLVIDTQQMVSFMDWAHIAIGAGGVSASERCARGLPSLTLVMAENQRQVSTSLAQQGACVNLGSCTPFPGTQLREALLSLLNEHQQYADMVSNAKAVVDGHGAERVGHALQIELGKQTIRLVPMTPSDCHRLWLWQCEPGNRRYFRHPAIPSWDEHLQWFNRIVGADDTRLFCINWQQQAVGMLRLDFDSQTQAEISILLSQVAQGKGIARHALQLLCSHYSDFDLRAEIHVENHASRHLFTSCGFQPLDATHYLHSRSSTCGYS